jgi:hypothetical protein
VPRSEPTLAEALGAEIARRAVSQAEAARIMDVHPSRLNRWLLTGDEPTPDAYAAVVEFLHLDGLDALGGMILRGRVARAGARSGRPR